MRCPPPPTFKKEIKKEQKDLRKVEKRKTWMYALYIIAWVY